MVMSSPPTTPMSQASTKFGLDSSMSLEDAKSFRRRAVDHVKEARTAQDIVLFLIAFRILNALTIRTFFQPDEFFQSLEPAWEIAFGAHSGAWITWEWKNHLRSSIHPALFAGVYWISSSISGILRLSPTLHADLMIAAPKTAQALIAALGDYYTWKLGERVYGVGSNEAWAALALTVISPWQWFCSTRTLSNCLETTLTIIALNNWPWQWSMDVKEEDTADEDGLRQSESQDETDELTKSELSLWDRIKQNIDQQSRLRRCLFLAAVACILRPTNILIWICIASFALFRTIAFGKFVPLPWLETPMWVDITSISFIPATKQERHVLFREASLCGSLVLILSCLVDRLYYQQWTFPPLRFLYFNIAQSLAVFYGKNRWDYYLTEGFPLLLTTLIPFGAIGIYQSIFTPRQPPRYTNASATTRSIKYQLATTTLLVPIILSFISHKEVRFIYPLLPLLHLLAATPFTSFFLPAVSPTIAHPSLITPKRALLSLLLITNLALALLATTLHQTAPLTVLSYLRHQHTTHYLPQPPAHTLAPAPSTMTVGFLTPCHSTPWRSHLIFPSIKAWALSCDPPIGLDTTARALYLDEADRFYSDPRDFLSLTLGAPPLPRRKKRDSWLAWFRPSTNNTKPKRGFGREEMTETDAWDGKEGRKTWPDYVVFFAQMEETMQDVLRDSAYRECWRGWNSWGHDDWRRRGDMVVWCLRKQGKKVKRRLGWWW